MFVMAKKRGRPRKHDTGSQAAGVPSGQPLHVNISPELAAAVERFIDAQDIAPSKTAVVEHALKKFLAANGFWPAADSN